MRTVYACSLEFQADKLIDGRIDLWSLVSTWCEESYQKHVPGCLSGMNWHDPQAQDVSTPDGGRMRLEVLTDHSGASLLREVRMSFSDVYDPSLIWNSDCRLLEDVQGSVFELTLTMGAADFCVTPARFQLGTPRIVRRLVSTSCAEINAASILNSPYRFSAMEIDTLKELLLWGGRRFPVVLVTPDANTGIPHIDAAKLAGHLSGLAVVVEPIDKWTLFALSDEVGKTLSCFDGGVRIYWPGFSLTSDPRHHSLWLGKEVAAMGEAALSSELSRLIFGVAAYRYVEHQRIRKVRSDAVRLHAEQSVARTKKDRDYDALFEEYVTLDFRTKELEADLESAQTEIKNLRENQTTLLDLSGTCQQAEDSDDTAADSTGFGSPNSVLEAVNIASATCPNLLFLDDSLRAAAESPYKNPERVLALLQALDEISGEWRSGQTGRSWKDAFREKGFDYKDDISKTARGKWKDDYTHTYKGKPVLFEKHITIGAKQADKCLSVHFERDDIDNIVVVAHVGRHKTNTSS